MGASCCSAAASRLDICDRLAQFEAKGDTLQKIDTYRISDPINAAKGRRNSAIFQYGSSYGKSAVRRGALTLAGWSAAAYASRTKEGRRRGVNVIGTVPSSLRGPCRVLPRSSKFTRAMAENGLGGEVMDHMISLREV